MACVAPVEEGTSENIGRVSSELSSTTVSNFGANPAQLSMSKFVPSAPPAGPAPLVVVLHGCTQTPSVYESAGWNDLAELWKFYVVYAAQNTTRNNSSGCFNWGGRWKSAPSSFVLSAEALELDEIQRGHGENESIKEMVDKMKADHKIDDKRVFVTGLSAGGAMTALMLATWPDVFAGGAVFAGIPYGCATDQKTTAEASNCTKDYTGSNAYLSRTPKAWGDLVRSADPAFTGTWPRVQIWHGTADTVVNSAGQRELVKQWTDVHGVGQTPTATDTVEGYPHEQYKDASGKVVVETFKITGKSHGTEVAAQKPLDPGKADGPKCGKVGSYIIEAGICSTYHAAKFFGLDTDGTTGGSSSGSNGSSDGGSSSGGTSSGGTSSGGASSGGASSGGASSGAGTSGQNGKWVDGSASSTCGIGRSSAPNSSAALVLVGAVLALSARRRRTSK